MNGRVRSALMLVVTMAIWGSTFVVTKYAIRALPPLQLAFVRVVLGALVLAPFAWRRFKVAGGAQLPWVSICLLGTIGVALYYIAFNYALSLTTAAQGALVQSCIPAVTALIAVMWLRERAPVRRWIGIGLSVAGVVIIFAGAAADASNTSGIGNVLMFGTVVAWGLYTALAKRVAHWDTLVVTAALLGVGALLLLPLAAWEYGHTQRMLGELNSWFAIAYLGCGASGVAYLLYNSALREMDANQAGAYTNLIPIVGVVSGVLLGDSLTAVHVLGGALVAVGVVLTTVRARA